MNACRKLTNLTIYELQILFYIAHDAVGLGMFLGSGRKYADSPKHLLFMLLVSLKHKGEWTFFAAIFGKNSVQSRYKHTHGSHDMYAYFEGYA